MALRALALALLLSTRALADPLAPELVQEDDYRTPRVLMIIGGVMLGVAYSLSVLSTLLLDAAGGTNTQDHFAYVPVVGPFTAAPPHDNVNNSVFLISDGAVQSIGMLFIFLAVVGRHPNPEDAKEYRWSLAPQASGHSAGVSLVVNAF